MAIFLDLEVIHGLIELVAVRGFRLLIGVFAVHEILHGDDTVLACSQLRYDEIIAVIDLERGTGQVLGGVLVLLDDLQGSLVDLVFQLYSNDLTIRGDGKLVFLIVQDMSLPARGLMDDISGVPSSRAKVLPQNTICNYHYYDLYYSSEPDKTPKKEKSISFLKGTNDDILTALYSVLLNYGWQKETCCPESLWNDNNPCVGQSAPTAILLQHFFGGDICMVQYSNRSHYFNSINGHIVDLTSSELPSREKGRYYAPDKYVNLGGDRSRKVHKRNQEKFQILLSNCKK